MEKPAVWPSNTVWGPGWLVMAGACAQPLNGSNASSPKPSVKEIRERVFSIIRL